MIRITIPPGFYAERSYIADILLGEFLGLDFELTVGETGCNYILQMPSGNRIIFEDHFFNNSDENTGYLYPANIPASLEIIADPFTQDKNLVVIFGRDFFQKNETETSKSITCGIDVFASAFFMLTRWEEIANNQRDEFGRTSESSMTAVKYGFIDIPVVDAYCLFIRNCLKYCNYNVDFREWQYEAVPGHDVDYLLRYADFFSILKTVSGDLIRRRNPGLAWHDLKSAIYSGNEFKADPFYSFAYLMDISDKHGLTSTFFFIPVQEKEPGCNYRFDHPLIPVTIQMIQERGHKTGLHGSSKSFRNKSVFREELNRLKDAGAEISETRMHYLRFDNPGTWQTMDDLGIRTSINLGYYSAAGFRCGTCREYSVFNLYEKKKLNLKEMPLIAMDSAVRKSHPEAADFFNEMIRFSGICRRYSGKFTFLWHNSSFGTDEWNDISAIYPEMVKVIAH